MASLRLASLARLVPWIGAIALCLISAQVPAQTGAYQYPVTAKDVDPGIDHGNNANLPEEYQKQQKRYH